MGKLIVRGPVNIGRGVASVLAVTFANAPAMAQTVTSEPHRTHFSGENNIAPKTLRTFTVNGQQLSVVAYGRNARADTQGRRDLMDEARAMDKVMPGYPQPPIMTVDFKLWF